MSKENVNQAYGCEAGIKSKLVSYQSLGDVYRARLDVDCERCPLKGPLEFGTRSLSFTSPPETLSKNIQEKSAVFVSEVCKKLFDMGYLPQQMPKDWVPPVKKIK